MLQSTVRSSVGSSSKSESAEGNFSRQGSLRKVIPADPNKQPKAVSYDEDTQKMYRIFQQEYIILAEYNMVASESIKGVYSIPSRKDPFLWFGVIFVRNGLYEEGIFRFNIHLPESFPDSEHPKVIFTSEVFHPVIDSKSSELNLKGGFPSWKKGEQHIWQILKYIEWIFNTFPESIKHAINEEAVYMYKNDEDKFKRKVDDCIKSSIDHIYDPPATDDKHYLSFEEYRSDIHDAVRQQMLITYKEDESNDQRKGHSWVMAGQLKPMSRLPTQDSDL